MADPARDRLLMPPPSGSPKRPRPSSSRHAAKAMSAASSSYSSSTSSPAFSDSTKLWVKKIGGGKCWACGNYPSQTCHVIAQEDRQAPFWVELGLLDVPLHSFLNAIPLCGTCQDHFDCHIDAGFLFIPTDLDFFIEYKLDDRERRRTDAENGIVSIRRTPTAEQYKSHQVSQGIITADAIGGQYLPVFLKPYLHDGLLEFDITQALSKPREWHGAPLACLRRCLHALGSPHLRREKRESYDKLLRLHDLYFSENGHSSSSAERLPDPAAQPEPIDRGKKRPFDSIAPGDSQSAKRHEGHQEGQEGHESHQEGNNPSRDETTFCPILQREVRAAWSLGPDFSAEDAIREFAPVILRSQNSTHA